MLINNQDLNYIWLNQEFGNVLDISYEEPVNFNNLNYDQSSKRDKNNRMIGNWKPYTDEIWEIHCDSKVIDHCNNLVENHVSSFINPNTRFARLRFTIQNHEGQIIEMEPTVRFYELEQNFFNENICKD